MNALVQTFIERRSDLWEALLQHLKISVIALLIAMVIAIPVAIWATRHKKFAEILLQIAGVLQTIPSLALLGLLIPFVGIGNTPAIIALVVYAILPIFQNTYIGLDEIDPSIEEAATAFGMSFFRKLIKVELPMAMPVIISGVRTAFVMIVGTATLAALIGAGGLGTFILLGIDRNNVSLTLIGAISSAVLAIIISALISLLQRVKFRYTAMLVGALAVGFVGTEIYGAVKPQQENVVIAGKLGSEPDILINMYKDLVEQEDPNIHVQLKENFGKTSFLFEALKGGSVDIYPEFTGTVLESLVKQDSQAKKAGKSADETYQNAKRLLSSQFKMTYLKPMAYDNTYALAVKERFAKQHQITTISDLAKQFPSLNAGFTLEFTDRPDGYKALQKAYGLNFNVKTMEPKLRYTAIDNQDVQVVDAYSTDSELRQYRLLVLKDNKTVFPTYQGAPLMKSAFAKKHPKIVKALNRLAGKISEKEMQEMNYQVNVQGKSAATVARSYLKSHGMLR